MILAEELRVGNWLFNQVQNKYFQVNSVVIHRAAFGDTEYYEPIELTEEILLKCGFEKGLKYFSYKDFDVDLKGWFGFNNMVANANIKYLHQLQNLYWCLCGKELNVNM